VGPALFRADRLFSHQKRPPIRTAAARIPNAIQPHGVSSAGSCDEATAAPAAAAAAVLEIVVVTVVAGRVAVVAGSVSVVATVTVLVGRVSVTAGRVSVTVTGGYTGASVVVSTGTVVCVWAPVGGVVVAVVRVRVTRVESAGWLPPPQPAVAIATTTPTRPAVA